MFLTSTIGVAIGWRAGRVDMQIDIGIDPQAAFLHVAIGNAQVRQQKPHFLKVRLGLGWRAEFGLADDFQQRRTRAVQVDAAVGLARRFVVHALAGVFLQMGTNDADPLRGDCRSISERSPLSVRLTGISSQPS